MIDVERQEYHKPTGQITGIDLGLKEFYADAQGNTVENPRYLRKSEKRLKKAQRRLSKRFCKGNKQSNNYHKQRIKVAKLHLKVSRQRKDKAIKDALALVQSNDLVFYEALKIRNLVKNRQLSKSGLLKKFFVGVGCGVWGVGFYRFSGGQLPNFQGKST